MLWEPFRSATVRATLRIEWKALEERLRMIEKTLSEPETYKDEGHVKELVYEGGVR